MKFSLLLFVGLLATSFAYDSTRKIEFQPSKTYVYNYRTKLSAGIPELGNQYAGLKLKSRIVLSPLDNERVSMKMDQLRSELLNKENSENSAQLSMENLESHLSKPIEFHYVAGKVKSFRADSREPEWSLNIKRAVLSLLSVDLSPQKVLRSYEQKMNDNPVDTNELVYYGVYENTVAGNCETFYEMKQTADPRARDAIPEAGLNVTKVINYGRCTEEPMVNANLESQGCNAYCAYNKQYNTAGRFQLKGYYPVDHSATRRPEFVKVACECKLLDLEMPVDQFTTVKYNISLEDKVFQSINADGQIILNKGHQKLSVASVSTLNLAEIREHSDENTPKEVQTPKQHDNLIYRLNTKEDKINLDIPYYSLFNFPAQEEIASTVKRAIYDAAEDVNSGNELASKKTAQKILSIVDSMSALKKEYLDQVFENFAQTKESLKDRTARKVFLDCLALTGTNAAAQLIQEAISKNKITECEAHELLEALPNNMYFPSKETINAYMKLVEEERYIEKELHTVLTVAVGKLIRKGCERAEPTIASNQYQNTKQYSHPRNNRDAEDESQTQSQSQSSELCTSDDVEQYARKFAKLLTESDRFATKFAYIEALSQMSHPIGLSVLEPYISGKISSHRCPGYQTESPKEECDYLRTHVIYAMHKFSSQYPAQVRALAMPVYRDINEAHEIRIAALTLLMYSNPSKYQLQTIANSLKHENNRQIVAMTYSYLEQISKLTYPKYQEIAQAAKEILATIPEVEMRSYSKVSMKDFVHPIHKEGAFVHHQYAKSNYTSLPTSFYLALGRLTSTSHKPTFTFAYTTKGFEDFVTKLYSYWANEFGGDWEKFVTEMPRVDTQSPETETILKEISEKLNLKIRESPDFKFKMSFQLFDNSGVHFYDESSLRRILEKYVKKAIEMAKKVQNGETLQFVKIFMPSNYNKIVVNEQGMPIVVRQRHPLLVAFKIQTVPSVHSKATLALKVQPTVSCVEVTEIASPLWQMADKMLGSKVTKQIHFSLPLKIVLALKTSQRRAILSVVAERKNDILVQEIRPVTYVKESKLTWEGSQQHNAGEKMIQASTSTHKNTKVYNQMLGYGIEETTVQDMPIMAEEYLNKAMFNPLAIPEVVKRLLANMVSKGNGYVWKKWSIKADETEQPEYHFAVQHKAVTNLKYVNEEGYETYRRAKNFQYDEASEERNIEESDSRNQPSNYENESESATERYEDDERLVGKLDRIISDLDMNKETLIKKVTKMIQVSSATWKDNRESERQPAVYAHNIVLVILNRGQVWKQMGLNAIIAHTVDQQVAWYKVDGFMRFAEQFLQKYGREAEQHQRFCTETVVSWPKMLDVFHASHYLDTSANEDIHGNLRTYLGWGQRSCSEGKIMINGRFERSPVDKVFRSNEHNDQADRKPWFVKQCTEDLKQNKKASLACEMAIEEQSKLNQITLDIKYDNLSPVVANLTAKLDATLKAKYWQYMDLNAAKVKNEDNRVKISAHYSEKMMGIPVINLYLKKPREEVFFKHVVAPIKPTSSWSWLKKSYQQNPESHCMVVDRHVRTFDNVTYTMPETDCKYLLAMDCSKLASFAIYAWKRGTNKVYTVIARGKAIEVQPFKSQENTVKIIVDRKNEFEVRSERPFIYRDLKVYLRQIQREAQRKSVIVVEVGDELEMTTDSKNIKIKSHPRFTGRVCGLCGNKDYEAEQEFEAANRCVAKRAEDFVYSYVIKSENCAVPEIRGPMHCNKYQTKNSEEGYENHENEEDEKVPTNDKECEYKKTQVVYRSDKVCFSKFPVMACHKNCRVESKAKKQVSYVCYPQNDVFTRHMIQSAKNRVLYELVKTARVNFEETTTLPTSCTLA